MAFYTGQASSYSELLNVLVNSCVLQGWTWSDGILSKEKAFVRPYVSSSQVAEQGPGLCIEGGTGKSGNTLVNPSLARPRLGGVGLPPAFVPAPIFPLKYNIFIFNNPNEVFLIVRYDIDRFMFLSFGYSTVSGCGLWLSATVSKGYNDFNITGFENTKGFSIGVNSGGEMWVNPARAVATAFFWQTVPQSSELTSNSACFIELENIGWAYPPKNIINAVNTIQPHIGRLPSKWSSNSPLLAIQPILVRQQNKQSIVAEIQNARYMRIDNYEPEEIITLGNDRWMVLPFHKKNLSFRDGVIPADHSGTFGWAIRYEGP